LYWICKYLESGTIHIADPKTIGVTGNYGDALSVGGLAGGYGNVKMHTQQLLKLQQFENRLLVPTWLGEQSGFHRIPLPDNSVDCIYEHGTSLYLIMNWLAYTRRDNSFFDSPLTNEEEQGIVTQYAAKGYREYFRALKHRGSVVLQTNRAGYQPDYGTWKGSPEYANQKDILRSVGFQVQQYRINQDKTLLTGLSYDEVQYLHSLRTESFTYLELRESVPDTNSIVMYPWCACPDLLVATKP
jgi:hypothetical protein